MEKISIIKCGKYGCGTEITFTKVWRFKNKVYLCSRKTGKDLLIHGKVLHDQLLWNPPGLDRSKGTRL
jgi:hypothetical protein